jgi:hypothetical protein
MTMTLNDLITSIEVELEQAQRDRDKAIAEIKYILSAAQQEARSNLTKDESERTENLFALRDRKKSEIEGIRAKLESARRARQEELEAGERAKQTHSGADAPAKRDGHARVVSEPRTYSRERDPSGVNFLRDVARTFLYQDPQSQYRLQEHMREERVERAEYLERASDTSNFAGLVVPQYLTDMYAPNTAALRPLADICNKHPLPASGMTLNISQITTPTSVAAQTAQNIAVSSANPDDTLLAISVKTAAGQATLSRQAIDRGTGVDDITMDDLFRRYATNLDSQLINDGTTGLDACSQNNTVGTVGVSYLYSGVLGGAAGVEAAVLGFAIPDFVVMHSRRWYWLSAQLTASWPFVNQPGSPPVNIGTNFAIGYNKGVRGVLPNGMGVVVDNNISTVLGGTAGTQDEVFVVASQECHLWEDPGAPVFIRAEGVQAQTLGVVLVIYGYFAYTFQRYSNATQKLTGAGLVAPTF